MTNIADHADMLATYAGHVRELERLRERLAAALDRRDLDAIVSTAARIDDVKKYHWHLARNTVHVARDLDELVELAQQLQAIERGDWARYCGGAATVDEGAP